MKKFKDLYIHTNDESITELVSKVTKNVHSYWSRSYESEKNSRYFGEVAFSFKRVGDRVLPDAGVSIFKKEKNIWYIPNVVPLRFGQLSYDEYNEIITDFYNTCLKPAASELEIHVEITSGMLNGEDIVGNDGLKLLNVFSSFANKSTGSSHPRDQERWFAFIVKTCSQEQYVNSSDLIRLLCEQGWDEDSAQKLAIEYEFARDLIKYMEI